MNAKEPNLVQRVKDAVDEGLSVREILKVEVERRKVRKRK